jgi:MFS family permease
MDWSKGEKDGTKAWSVAAGCAIATTFALMPMLIGALPTLAVQMEQETGWSRGQIMACVAIIVLSGAALGPYAGKLVDQRGGRQIIIWSQIGASLALMGMLFVGSALSAFYALMFFAGIVAVGASPISYSKVLIPWFDKNRGMALGISVIGVGISAIIMPLLTAYISEALGWRQTLAIYGLAAAVIAIPVQLLFIRDYPRGEGQVVYADPSKGFIKAFVETWKTYPHFRKIILLFCIMGMAHAGIVLNLVPMQEDRGMDKTVAAGAQSALGIALIVGRLFGGYLFDKFSSPRPLLAGIVPATIGIAMLGFVDGVWGVYAAAALIGLGSGIENDGIPYLVSRYFPQEHFAKLSAAIQSFSAFALAIGPGIAALTYDLSGDYFLACMISAGLLVIVALLALTLPQFEGEAVPMRPAAA